MEALETAKSFDQIYLTVYPARFGAILHGNHKLVVGIHQLSMYSFCTTVTMKMDLLVMYRTRGEEERTLSHSYH